MSQMMRGGGGGGEGLDGERRKLSRLQGPLGRTHDSADRNLGGRDLKNQDLARSVD